MYALPSISPPSVRMSIEAWGSSDAGPAGVSAAGTASGADGIAGATAATAWAAGIGSAAGTEGMGSGTGIASASNSPIITSSGCAARMGGVAATPACAKSTNSSDPRREISGSSPGARFTTRRTSECSTSGCSNDETSETGPPGSGAMRTAASGSRAAPMKLSTSVSGSGS